MSYDTCFYRNAYNCEVLHRLITIMKVYIRLVVIIIIIKSIYIAQSR